MVERRTLVEGLKSTPPAVDPLREQQFVKGPTKPEIAPPQPSSRSPLSTRIRADFAAALKRASLERQLSGTEPNTLQDILEQAIEPWLRTNGYIT